MIFKKKYENLLLVFFVSLLAVVIVRNAWLCDDAYITFRTVDNFIHGYGLTWNVAERVQAYTHPLWMFLVSGLYFFTHEVYYSSIFLSIGVSLMAAVLLVFKIARSTIVALLGITILIFSKAFIDYSTSGLENPLTHLILALFLFVYFKSEMNLRTFFLLSLIAAMGMFNRMDTFLLFFPALVYVLFRLGKFKGLYVLILGFVPFILWECFSVFYYGFPFPNTAYAKLNTGISISRGKLIEQGCYYLMNSIKTDPITILIILAGIATPFLTKKWRNLPVVFGIVLYLLYVVIIGGDFMSGRLLTAPLFCAVILLSRCHFTSLKLLLSAFLIVIFIGFVSPCPSPLSSVDYGLNRGNLIDNRGIADERAYYYQFTGLLKARENIKMPNNIGIDAGREARAKGPFVVEKRSIGFFGFYAGQEVHIVDILALADPLLARLPPIKSSRIGHFERIVPYGYPNTLDSGVNTIRDKNLAVYYDKLSVITRGELFSMKRLIEIWKMNTGKYNTLIKAYLNHVEYVSLSVVNKPKKEGVPCNLIGNVVFLRNGILIDLEKQYHAKSIEISLDHNDTYQIIYYHQGLSVAAQTIPAHPLPRGGLVVHLVNVSQEAAKKGYDKIMILPLQGDDAYGIGHIRLLE